MNNSIHGLSDNELNIIKTILSKYKDNIDKVCIFGSRSNQTYKEYSDIDLVLYGDINQNQISRIHTLFDESNLGLKVDIKGYETTDYPPLKRFMHSHNKVLFSKNQLD